MSALGDRPGPLDAASLHPWLQPTGMDRHYFAEAARLRAEIAGLLVRDLGAGAFVPYLVQNATAGLTAVLWAAARAGRQVHVPGPAAQHHPDLHRLLPWSAPAHGWSFRTHVSPLTGHTDPLPDAPVRIVDASQSLGTTLTGAALRGGDVLLAPLHLHLGLAVGVGLVLVRREHPELDPVHAVLAGAEADAQSLAPLRQVARNLSAARGSIVNRAEIRVDERLRAWGTRRGLSISGSPSGVPFACVSTVDGTPVADRIDLAGWWHHRDTDTARFAVQTTGLLCDGPVDRTDAFTAALGEAGTP
ncbi:DUF6024 family protein [Longispora sp. NPDC051575]|uniref:DUF6024 family protein n=1 Tax=Longispora sp. NPDC051575 TaxID=3154943 RepID=UPI0034127117